MKIINQPYGILSKILLILFSIGLLTFLFSENFFLAVFALLPAWIVIYQTGVEIDFKNKRLRNIAGPFASKAEEWQDISDATHLGMVDVREGRSLQPYSRPDVVSVHVSKVAVNMFFEDRRHIQVFRGPSKEANRIVDIIFKELDVTVFDPKDDDEE